MNAQTEGDEQRLRDILEAAYNIKEYVRGLTPESFQKEFLVQDAVLYNFVKLGEAVNHLSEAVKKRHAYPWHRAVSIRNRATHEYSKIDPKILWRTIEESLKEFELFV